MGRPLARNERKSETINIRVTPSVKARLEAEAKSNGRKLSAECEERLVQAERWDGVDKETEELLAGIIGDIRRAQELTGKRWHKDLRTWAMVREALASGEIEQRVPAYDRVNTDVRGTDGAADRLVKLTELSRKREFERMVLDRMGVYTVMANDIWPTKTDREETMRRMEGLTPGYREMAEEALGNLVAVEEEYTQVWDELRLIHREQTEAINEAVDAWKRDLIKRQRYTAREYRPGFLGNPPPSTGGMFAGRSSRPVLPPDLSLSALGGEGDNDAIDAG